MTDEKKKRHLAVITTDTDEQLLERFIWYVRNWNPIDYDRCDDYELIKAEILKRMGT